MVFKNFNLRPAVDFAFQPLQWWQALVSSSLDAEARQGEEEDIIAGLYAHAFQLVKEDLQQQMQVHSFDQQ